MKEAFQLCPLGIKTATQPNYDIILVIRAIRSTLQAALQPIVCPVHPPLAETSTMTPTYQPINYMR